MPKYSVRLANGKMLTLEGDAQPSDADFEEAAKGVGIPIAAPDKGPQRPTGDPNSAGNRFFGSLGKALDPRPVFDAMRHPGNTYDALVDKSAQNFGEAGRILDDKKPDYGHALAHGIAGILPPFNLVTEGGDQYRRGDVAGAMGSTVGGIGQGLLTEGAGKVLGNAPAIAKAVPRTVGKTLRATPDWAVDMAATGAGIYEGGATGGLLGYLGGHGPLRAAVNAGRKMGLDKDVPSVGPTVDAAAKLKPIKSDKVRPMTREEIYDEEIRNQRWDDEHGAGNSVPGNGMHGKQPTTPPVSMRMDMEPDLLKQDVVRWPRHRGLRSDESVQGLAKELNPNVKTPLSSYPRPVGDSELAKALRQRANAAENTPSVKKAAPKPLKAKPKVKK